MKTWLGIESDTRWLTPYSIILKSDICIEHQRKNYNANRCNKYNRDINSSQKSDPYCKAMQEKMCSDKW